MREEFEIKRAQELEENRRKEEERERERQIRLKELQEKEEEMERMRQIQLERQREDERREEERKGQMEKERAVELERKLREEYERKREQDREEKLQMEGERKRQERESVADRAETNVINFDSEDVPPKPLLSPTKREAEVVYDDFSVRPPDMHVVYDDFSVKPKRWGSKPKADTRPPSKSWADYSGNRQEVVDWLAPLEVSPVENRVREQVERTILPEPTIALESPEKEEEEEQSPEEEELISLEMEEEEDELKAPVNSYSPTGEDTDALIDSEPEQQNEACEQTSDIDSPEPVPDEEPEEPSEDPDTTDFSRVPEQAPFPESSTPLLDTSAQRSKAVLGKRRSRSRPPRSMRGGFSPKESQDWRAQDTIDEKKAPSKQRDSDSEEEQPKPKIANSPTPSQRVPMFTGLNPASLIAQLKRRTCGGGTRGGEEKEENKGREEKESRNEEAAPSPSKPSRSPRPAARSPRPAARSPRQAAHLPGAARVLPPIGGGGGGSVSSPAWLKELQSKKRLSHHDSEA
ncbi:hypothetical protein KUCAC02_030292 [Chaenocephalus aceratus]|uniref:Uncharacterized protein n=1 Tax=Chaenocephalus aceratus TaxID=36190 RepID=A0ACB9XJN2_CHAAC|nr:hypothetical protein KUCAC02_030292 [Chaenocephalus aceratus]